MHCKVYAMSSAACGSIIDTLLERVCILKLYSFSAKVAALTTGPPFFCSNKLGDGSRKSLAVRNCFTYDVFLTDKLLLT
jgi:hypothetical protein